MDQSEPIERLAAPDEAKRAVEALVERYGSQADYYASATYKETSTRRDFIDPFFEALGWDVANKQGWAEPYREVIHEDAIRVGREVRAPDYCFRVGGRRMFFVEAKKPSVSVKGDPAPAYQLRRYGWSAHLPLSVLTDFEEFAVYECGQRPSPDEGPSVARVDYIPYIQYLDRIDDIYSVFSKEAICRGAFDRYAEGVKRKRGTQTVDRAFLAEIEAWREALAKDIARNNPDLSIHDLNAVVQATINRILFLRIAEDRGVERYGRLRDLAGHGGVYADLLGLYQEAEEKYNSGLFDFGCQGDGLSGGLTVSDKVLKPIVGGLYYPECPYEFSVIGADILGAVYEQFLGKTIRLTAGHRAKVEEKPEVRKAGGVYYTPTYIVDYIVKHTVGELLEEAETPERALELRILDPACGSGSFLLGAYQYLLDWHLRYYVAHDPEKRAKERNARVVPSPTGDWRLSLAARKEILTRCIYGVDLDRQAVEVAKLNLLLKCMEGETEHTVGAQLRLFHERVLPNIDANIKCGNSLIGPDYWEGRQGSMFDEDEARRVNPFDWESGFPEVMKRGGFDAVIGNPPYLFITEVPNADREYYQRRYRGVAYRFDLYAAFIERAAGGLLRCAGRLGYIIPHTLLSNESYTGLRGMLASETWVNRIVDLGPGVFTSARNETMLLFLVNEAPRRGEQVEVIRTTPREFTVRQTAFSVRQGLWLHACGRPWVVHAGPAASTVAERMRECSTPLGDLCTVSQGLRTGDNERYLAESPSGAEWKAAAGGKHIARYGPIASGIYVRYVPALLDAPRREELFTGECKLVVQEVRNIALSPRIVATLDRARTFCLQSTNVINRTSDCPYREEYLLGVLNSRAADFAFRTWFAGNNHIASYQLCQVPVPDADQHQQMALGNLVLAMLDLHKRLPEAKTAHDRELIQRQIDATDRQIDRLVYDLYGLTDEEIAIVEESVGNYP